MTPFTTGMAFLKNPAWDIVNLTFIPIRFQTSKTVGLGVS